MPEAQYQNPSFYDNPVEETAGTGVEPIDEYGTIQMLDGIVVDLGITAL